MKKKEDFKKLVDKYLDARTSLEEEKRLLGYYEAMQKNKKWDSNLMGDEKQVQQRIFSNILEEIDGQDRFSKTKIASFKKWMVAASIVFLLGLGATFLYFQDGNIYGTNEHTNIVNLSDEILPGGNKATLTLSDGTQIVLDDAENGELAAQNNTIVRKTKDGQLVYDLSAPTSLADKETFNTITTPRGGQYQLILPDGTKVWLNAMSSLTFPSAFSGVTRHVDLSGEAYFEVSKNHEKPFHVNVGNTHVKVLGTAFNIMAYADENYLETTLSEGSVEVSLVSTGQSLVISPGQQAQVGENNTIKVVTADVQKIIAWKDGYFNFSRDNIQSIMKKFEKWYNIEVKYEGDIPQEEFVGKIRRSVTLSQALRILKLSDINFKIEGRQVIVSD